MSEYRRYFVPGGTYFFTVVTYRRQRIFANERNVGLLRDALRAVRAEFPFEIVAAVTLPDHLHFIWTLPAGDDKYSRRLGRMKPTFSSRLAAIGETGSQVSASRRKHRESGVWQRRFWEHTIRDEDDLKAHLDYIHYNPVKHGLVHCPHAWPYSSFLRWVERGEYDACWGCQCKGNLPAAFIVREPKSGAGEP